MTAFVVEALLLIAAAFGIGVCLGLMLGRRLRARAGRALPAAAPAVLPAGSVAAAPVADRHPAPALAAAEGEAMPPSLPVVEAVPAVAEPAVQDGAVATVPPGASGRPLPGVRPPAEAAVAGAPADDLKRLKGIGPLNEQRLHALGIHHFRQIAAWTPAEVEWVGSYLAFPGRIEREDWVGQAQAIVAGTAPEALRMPPRKSR